MKKLTLIILLILCTNIYSQVTEGWNPVDTTIIPSLGTENIALFANHAGIHILQLIPTDTLLSRVKYFRIKSNGQLDTSIVFENWGKFPNIVGDEDKLFAIYQNRNRIIVKKSTDNGNSWNPEVIRQFSVGSESNGVDAVYNNDKGLHIVWSQKEGTTYESYFATWNGILWQYYSQITNHDSLQKGGFPTLTISNINGTQKVHFCINTGTSAEVNSNAGQNFSRDFNYSTWENPINILPAGTKSMVDRLLVTNDGMMHCFFYTTPTYGIGYRKKPIGVNTTWGSASTVTASINFNNMEKIELSKTNNQLLHAFWMGNNPLGFNERNKSSTATDWSQVYNINGGTQQRELATISNSNDLYVIFSQNVGVNTLRLRQYDANPLAPQNLTVTKSANNHPLLNWNRNNETDLQHYIIYKKITEEIGFVPCSTSTTNSFEDVNESYPKPGGIGITHPVSYKITAVDLHPFESLASNVVSTMVSGASPEKIITDPTLESVPAEYSLQQNFPNPFNPSTKISYSIKEEGLVTLKVYDVLGKEITTLVNENKPEGNYEVEFDASQLPSGMYIYSIQAGEFKESKKMLLMK